MNCVNYHQLSDKELNDICCQRLGWELKSHRWNHGSVWHEHAWFKGEAMMGFPNFVSLDPVTAYLHEHIESQQMQEMYGHCIFEVLDGHRFNHPMAWYTLATASPRHKVLAFLMTTQQLQNSQD